MKSQLSGVESLQCEYIIPKADSSGPSISRWSDTQIEHPALVVLPKTERDVQTSISIARDNKLELLVGGGTHGTFVSVGPCTLYLDMKEFKTIELKEEDGTVRVGGGVLCGELMTALSKLGHYTPIPNSNAVGAVGCVIGGGSTPWNGLHGWMADIVKSFRVVTSKGDIVEVGASSSDPDLELFSALCGAGHGLCVVTEMTTSAFPVSSLNMTDGKASKRSLVFPRTAIETAAETFLGLHRPSPAASATISFVCTGPGSDESDPQVITAVESLYFGQAEEAEKEAKAAYKDDAVKETIAANTALVNISTLNDRFEPQNAHGGHKAIASCRLKSLTKETIQEAFEQWCSVIKQFPDAFRSPLVVSSYNSAKHVQMAESHDGPSFLEGRDRDFGAMIVSICEKEETMTPLTKFMDDLMSTFRKGNSEEVPRSFPNNLRFGMAREELFSDELWAERNMIKKTWDPEGFFWSPYAKP